MIPRQVAYNLRTQRLASEVGQHKAGAVNVLVVVTAQLLFLLPSPGADGLTHVAAGVLAADHETDLARGVGGDGGVGVFRDREDLLAGLLEVGDQREVEPLVLGYETKSTVPQNRARKAGWLAGWCNNVSQNSSSHRTAGESK